MAETREIPRHIHAFCIGAPKTGTKSMMEMFQSHYRSAHEPETGLIVIMQNARWCGGINHTDYLDFIVDRDRRLNLDLEASNCVIYLVEGLVQLFPAAKFVLTIRDCFSWLDSIMQAHLSLVERYKTGPISEFRHRRFQYGLPEHTHEEESLRSRRLFTVGGCFAYWSWHNQTAIDLIPKERLLVIRTDKLSSSLTTIANFLQVDCDSLVPSHSNITKKPKTQLSEVPRQFIKMKAREHCWRLMERYFPEIDLS